MSFDSIAVFLANRENCCPNDADAFCLEMLLAIQTDRFTCESLASPELYFHLREASSVLAKVISRKGCDGYYSSKYFSGCPYAYPIFMLIEDWAKKLIVTRTLDSTRLFLCNVLAGNLQHPMHVIREEKAAYRFLDSPFVKAYELHRDKRRNINASIGMGIFLPDGHLITLGAHPGVYTSVGIRAQRSEWSLTGGGQFLDAPQSYTLLINDSVHTGHHFDGWLFGLDYDYYFPRRPHFEWGVMAGVGFMGMDIGYRPAGAPKSSYQQASCFYQSMGLRTNYFFDHYNPRKYVGLTAKYSFLHYGNTAGLNLSGNALSIDICYGGNN